MGKFSDALRAEISSYDDAQWTGTLGGIEITLFSKPLTPQDMGFVGRKCPGWPQVNPLEGMVEMIIRKATDGNGEKAFDLGDRPSLMRTGINKVSDIFGALYPAALTVETDEAFEERQGN